MLVGLVLLRAIAQRFLTGFRQFGMEKEAGLSRITHRRFIADSALQGALLLAAAIPLSYGAVYALTEYPQIGWLIVAIGWSAFMIAHARFYPTLVAPLFNSFKPLADEPLRKEIDRRAANAGCRLDNLYVMDGSVRSAAGNAKVDGFGRSKRVVLLDTLFHILTPAEIIAVACHELGHVKHRHIAFFETLMALLRSLWIVGFGYLLSPENPILAVALLWLCSPLMVFFIKPPLMALIRGFEHQADAFAAANGDGKALLSALKKLSDNNRASEKSDSLFRLFHHAHPDDCEREKRLTESSDHVTSA